MKLSYDPRHNIAYITLREDVSEVESVQVGEDLTVDIAPDGTVVGIEFLNANAQLRSGNAGQLLVIDEESGASSALALPA